MMSSVHQTKENSDASTLYITQKYIYDNELILLIQENATFEVVYSCIQIVVLINEYYRRKRSLKGEVVYSAFLYYKYIILTNWRVFLIGYVIIYLHKNSLVLFCMLWGVHTSKI